MSVTPEAPSGSLSMSPPKRRESALLSQHEDLYVPHDERTLRRVQRKVDELDKQVRSWADLLVEVLPKGLAFLDAEYDLLALYLAQQRRRNLELDEQNGKETLRTRLARYVPFLPPDEGAPGGGPPATWRSGFVTSPARWTSSMTWRPRRCASSWRSRRATWPPTWWTSAASCSPCSSPRKPASAPRSAPLPHNQGMRPFVISHAACGGHAPENTLAGVRAALEIDADAIEIDVQASADRNPVAMHAPTVG